MNSIITKEGEYLKTEFTGVVSKVTWYLIETRESTEDVDGWNHWKAINAFDTFRSRKDGTYMTIQRHKVFDQAEAKNII